ncbi:MAG: phosphotransacetylase family protein [Candidatus Bathyarchaeota archaeon]|nr:MAG: phosphotransacetylase family protein [Candidatus Bathyarchaeota archaeon]
MNEKPCMYICSPTSFSGKSLISLGLALNFREQGHDVGYFKPVGCEMGTYAQGEKIDEDVRLMKGVLDLQLSMDVLVPVIFGARFLGETQHTTSQFYMKKILSAHNQIAQGKDILILEGPCSFGVGSCMDIDPISLSQRLNAPILLVSRFQDDRTIDQVSWISRIINKFGGSSIGLILNRIPREDVERVKRFALPVLNECGVELLGIVPENLELMAPTVREICTTTKCEVLTATDHLDNLIEDFLVGAMSPESSLSYFRRSFRKAVITGGDRTDVQLAALETKLSALILTGNLYPDARVLARAEELDVPVLLAPWDTYSTVRRISSLTGRINPEDERKISLAKTLISQHVNWMKILNRLIPK